MLALIFISSCQNDPEEFSVGRSKTLNLQVEIDQMGSGLQSDTRSVIVDHLPDENKVNDIHLLFFKKSDDGTSSSYTGCYKVDGPVTLDTKFALDYDKVNDGNYSVLAFANIEDYYINSPGLAATSLSDYLATLTPSTTLEEDVIKTTSLYVKKAQNLTDKAIKQDNLFMSGRTIKTDGDQLITLKLTRAVSRFDVQILGDTHEIASVSIWNNASKTPTWLSNTNASDAVTINPARFYGIEYPSNTKEVKGGLYTFENYNSDPAVGDDATTCLVLGIRPYGGGTEEYYRVNIHPEESGQSLKRNYVYQVTVRAVLGAGKGNEQEAYESKVDPNLDIDINNWSLDDEGVILTDGKNTLAVPSKIIRFAQEGGTRSYTIFTQGEGILTMSPNIPNGFSVTLSGNQLTVVAEPLGTLTKREGTLDISFAGLKATVQIIQEPKESHFLRVDKSIISGLPASVNGTYENNFVKVTSSKDWTAKIYNTGGSRFSFVKGDANALTTTGASGDDLKVYLSEDNATNKVLTGFVLIALQNEPGYNRVVMLKQIASPGISIDLGSLTSLIFKANGAPKTITGSRPGDAYEFEIDPGTDDNSNFNEWGAVLSGTNADKFTLAIEKTKNTNRVIITAKGTEPGGSYPHYNLTPNIIDNVLLEVYSGSSLSAVTGNDKMWKTAPISQEALVFSATGTTISKVGEMKDIQVTVPDGFKWKVKIADNWETETKYGDMVHKGYMYDGQKYTEKNDEITGLTGSTLKVGFDKLLFPIVNVSPKLKLEISLEDVAGFLTTIEVSQEALLPRNIDILDVAGTPNYGSFNNGRLTDSWKEFFATSTLFSTINGTSRCYAGYVRIPYGVDSYIPTGNPAAISPRYNLFNAGTTKKTWTEATCNQVEKWRLENDGIMLITQDTHPTYGGENSETFYKYLNKSMGYVDAFNTGVSNAKFETNTGNANRLLNYLYNDGPFGSIDLSIIANQRLVDVDNAHTAISRSTVEDTGVSILYEEGHLNSIMVFADPDKKVVWIGEVALVNYSHINYTKIYNNDSDGHKSRFVANLVSYIIRAAQYGSHFTDHFKKGSTTQYPFDKLKTTYPEPMFY